jgi:histone-lysine N-methyltransferase SETMAR
MLTIVWNPTGFHLINVLPNGIKFNSPCVPNIFVPLPEWRKTQVGGSDRKWIVHADKTGLHTAKVNLEFLKHNRIKRASHPRYSPDLAPSDFYLFGCIKQFLPGHEFPDREALLEAVRHILEGIEKVSLDQVFLTRMERLERCIKTNGEYVE